MGITYAELKDTPLETISFIAGDTGLQRVAFTSLKKLKEMRGVDEKSPSLRGFEVLSDLIQEMNTYLFGLRKSFSVDVDWEVLEKFQSRVLKRTAEIPYGEVMTYGQIAREIGQPGASRAVGRALGSNPMPVVIPCHRVIGSDGHLRGYTGGLEKKVFLLTLEGHSTEDGKLITIDESPES